MLATGLVDNLLNEYGALTREALNEFLPEASDNPYLYGPMADYPARGGKMMRPSICIATARAFGGSLEDAIFAAVSIELLHNALLIHDDIEDGSDERRGQPTLHRKWDLPIALNVGDALGLLSGRPLLRYRESHGPEITMRLLSESNRVCWESAEGQALELGWRFDNSANVTERDYLHMILKKTCWLAAIYPMRVGSLLATRSPPTHDAFVRFGFFLGAAFQIHDDVLNLMAEPEYGKEQDGDLWEGKRTLMIVHLFERATPDEQQTLKRILAGDRDARTEQEVRWMRERMDHYGSIEYARQVAHAMAGAAMYEFKKTFHPLPPSRDRQFLSELVPWVFERHS